MRFIHSSDLQIGKAFGFVTPEVAVLLQDARQAAVGKLGELAMAHSAIAVLLAGDIFDKQQLSQVTLAKPIEAMRRFPRVTWHLMPGNHDHVRENGLWDRLARMQLPLNVKLHVNPGAVEIADDVGTPVFLLPAPLRHIASVDDLSSYMDTEATPEGSIRIGMAHGSIVGFGSGGEAANYIAPTRAESARLAYLAMGDWHRQMRISDRVWYSGTPEPDAFTLPPGAATTLCNGGAALLVEISGPRAILEVTPIETGRYRWHKLDKTLVDDSQVNLLDDELRALDPNLGRVLLDLRISGTLSLAGRKAFEEKIAENVRAALCGMRLDDGSLMLEPTEADMDDIDKSGFVRVAADRLKAMADDPSDPARARIASLALKRLYVENIRHANQT
jgi:DNA repair exonuclease SbcCD nuclease subunit